MEKLHLGSLYENPKQLRYLVNTLLDFIDEMNCGEDCIRYLIEDEGFNMDSIEIIDLVENGIQ